MQPNFTQIHDAIQVAIAQASGVSAAKVIWQWQNADAPPLDYITLGFKYLENVGQDSLIFSTDLTRAPGQEIQMSVQGVREMGLEIQCFSSSLADDSDALSTAERIRTGLILPPIRDQFTAVNVSPFDPQPIQHVPEVVSVGFRGRAVLEVRCYVPAPFVAAYVGYIASIAGTINDVGGGLPTPDVLAFKVP